MSYTVLAHAAPYSSPNSSRRLPKNWVPTNIRVFQENPKSSNLGAGNNVYSKYKFKQ